jgi:hypothetical protein
MNPPIPLVMGIVTLFDWRMKYFLCFIGPKDSHPKLNWMAIHCQILIGPLKDEEAIDWCKSILRLSLDKGNKLKGDGLCVWKKEKGEGRGE